MDQKRTVEVFVAGRYPAYTYNPRSTRKQESEVRRYLDDSGKAMTVSGPSKSGKTVLLQHLLPESDAIWINGSELVSTDVLYNKIIDFLGIFDMYEVQQQTGSGLGAGVKVSAKFGGTGVEANAGGKLTDSETKTFSRTRSPADVAMQGLAELPVPIVIDDFHYVPELVKLDIVRAIKALLMRTHVIMIAVPHEAFDAVRQEPDMNGRVWNLQISPWEIEELVEVAQTGFAVLGIVDAANKVSTQLATASMGAPFLMQQLCLDYLLDEEIIGTQMPAIDLPDSSDWNTFFTGVANRSVPGVFDYLSRGPKTHGQERSERRLKDGSGSTDIYGAILYAVARMGPVASVHYTDLWHKIDELFFEAPQSQQVTTSLGHLRNIARENRGTSDAALDYKDDSLHILDPFLSFYLQHGSWALPIPPGKQ
ncbi:hypothetical protein [Herbiconiux solani]|uniref:hypothetical protein n=1 Tax=Herbiconiux solani TaxID=661329 RepID=UPI0012EDCE0F|nr:hypothetical protein [Herbiconiux solani]